MLYSGLQDNSAAVWAYYREHCDAFRVKDDTYLAFMRAMKEKWTRATGNSLTRFVWGVGQVWASNDWIKIIGYDGPSESEMGNFTSCCHISRDLYAFKVDRSNTSHPVESEMDRDEVVERFKLTTEKLLAA